MKQLLDRIPSYLFTFALGLAVASIYFLSMRQELRYTLEDVTQAQTEAYDRGFAAGSGHGLDQMLMGAEIMTDFAERLTGGEYTMKFSASLEEKQ